MSDELDPVAVAAAWRPQQFGRRGLRAILDPLVEPLWEGLRLLSAITPASAHLIHEGRRLDTPAPLVDQLVAALLADAVVVEGVLSEQALGTGEGAFPVPETGRVRPGRLLLGSLGARRERLAREHGEAIRAQAATAAALRTVFDRPTAFVATDLLWVDGQPLLDVPLLERKRLLESVLRESELVRRTAFVRPSAGGSLIAWRSLGFATLAYKESNSRYRPGEANDAWTTAAAPSTVGRPRPDGRGAA